jgi:hypothetical protein
MEPRAGANTVINFGRFFADRGFGGHGLFAVECPRPKLSAAKVVLPSLGRTKMEIAGMRERRTL